MKKILAIAFVAIIPLSASAKKENFKIVPENTKVTWEGRKIVGGAHQGELKLKSGKFEVDGDKVVGGEFVVDMESLTNVDITNEGMNKKLVDHLKNDDFFSIDKHKTAILKITKAEKKDDTNYVFSGDLTIKGIKKPVSFPAVVHQSKNSLHSTGTVIVDRTLYNVKYNSLKFFSNIGDKAIEDNFSVIVDITAKK